MFIITALEGSSLKRSVHHLMTKLRALAVLVVLATLLSWPCRKELGVRGMDLSVAFSARILTDNLFTDMSYRIRTDSSFAPITENNRIVSRFVHRGRLLFRDEYEPPVPTSKWEPDKEYTFTRRIYIPAFIDEFDAKFGGAERLELTVGLASPLHETGDSGLVLFRKTLRVVPSADSPVIVYLSGWYGQETGTQDTERRWRWTSKEARTAIDNPGRDALLVLRGQAGPATAGQKVAISIDGKPLEEFAPGSGEFERQFIIKKEWLGDKKDFELVIEVDKTFVPAKVTSGSKDERELGIRISLLYFR
jgi:hypothetical protein